MLTAIMAQSTDGVIGTVGKDGPCLPWRLPPDLKRFKRLTEGHAVIMGRTTFESIGRPLPKRINIVLTRDPHRIKSGDVAVFSTLDGALEYAHVHDPDPFIIGGGQVYRAFWDRIDRIELTEVDIVVGLGTVFAWDPWPFREVASEPRAEHDGLGYRFVTYERTGPWLPHDKRAAHEKGEGDRG